MQESLSLCNFVKLAHGVLANWFARKRAERDLQIDIVRDSSSTLCKWMRDYLDDGDFGLQTKGHLEGI